MKRWVIFLSLLIVAAFAALYLLSESIQAPEFVKIENCRLSKPDQNNIMLCEVDVVLKNPNKIAAKLIFTDINVFSDDLKLATISQTSVTDIPANQQFSLPLSCKINLINVIGSQGLSGLLEKALSSEKKLPLNFTGQCRVSVDGHVYRIPINVSETIVLK